MGSYCSRCGTQNSADSQFCIQCGGSLVPLPATVQPVVAVTTRYGGFWIRFIAFIIDAVLLQVVIFPLSFIVGAVIGIAGAVSHATGMAAQLTSAFIGGMLGLVGNWVYEAYMESSPRQATVGKMVFNMKVTDLQGKRISFAQASGRHFAKYLSSLTIFIGYIMAGFSEKKQALHDMIAGTVVRIP